MREVTFTEGQIEYLARFVAELTRQGVAYKVCSVSEGWVVQLTGGF